jgi:hypothetical protein
MLFEVFGFVSGVAAIGAAWVVLWRHDLLKVLNSFNGERRNRSRSGNALIWPSR